MNYAELRKAYKKLCEELAVDSRDIVLSAGGACLLLGLRRETALLDIDIPHDLYDRLLATWFYETSGENPPSNYIEYKDIARLHRQKRGIEALKFSGVWIYPIRELLKQKLHFNRAKDQDEIRQLRALVSHPEYQKIKEELGIQ